MEKKKKKKKEAVKEDRDMGVVGEWDKSCSQGPMGQTVGGVIDRKRRKRHRAVSRRKT